MMEMLDVCSVWQWHMLQQVKVQRISSSGGFHMSVCGNAEVW